MLGRKDFADLVDDYLDEGPAHGATNWATHPYLQRYHGAVGHEMTITLQDFVNGGTGGGFGGEGNPENLGNTLFHPDPLPLSDENYLNHTFHDAPEGSLFRYRLSSLQRDRRYNYSSSKYPWLLFAGR